MNKVYSTFLLLLLYSFNVSCQQTDYEKGNLKGNVQEIKSETFHWKYIGKIGLYKKELKGDFISYGYYNKFGYLDSSKFVREWSRQSRMYIYNADFTSVKEVRCYDDGIPYVTNTKFEKDNNSSVTFHLSKGDTIAKHIYEFNSERKPIRYYFYNRTDNSIDTLIIKDTFLYNSKGILIEEVSIDYESPYQSFVGVYQVDSISGLKLTTTYYDYKNKKENSYSYEYEFDKQGNWITKTIYKKKKIQSVIRREITYFD